MKEILHASTCTVKRWLTSIGEQANSYVISDNVTNLYLSWTSGGDYAKTYSLEKSEESNDEKSKSY